MVSSTLAISTSYHQPKLNIQKSKLDTKNVNSEDELLKFFLHGSYEVQHGNKYRTQLQETDDRNVCINDDKVPICNLINDNTKTKSRCMFEESYMINISVKQPTSSTKLTGERIDLRIEKTPSDTLIENENVGQNKISNIFDKEEELGNCIVHNEMTKLTSVDMINQTLTTNHITEVNDKKNWGIDKQNKVKSNDHTSTVKKVIKTPPIPSILQAPSLSNKIRYDDKLSRYLDYLEAKEDSNQSIKPSNIPTTIKHSESVQSVNPIPPKQEPLPMTDLEQLCRSLTVHDLKDELIRKKIYELKLVIDERHKNQIPLVKTQTESPPLLVPMPPVRHAQQQPRRRTTINDPTLLLQSKTVDFQMPYNYTYHDIISSHYNTNYSQPMNRHHML